MFLKKIKKNNTKIDIEQEGSEMQIASNLNKNEQNLMHLNIMNEEEKIQPIFKKKKFKSQAPVKLEFQESNNYSLEDLENLKSKIFFFFLYNENFFFFFNLLCRRKSKK